MTFFQRKSPNKFNAKRTTYNGQKFDSKGEAGYCEYLDWRIKAGEIVSYERQYKIPLKVNGVLIFTYFADFLVTGKHGEKEIHEYKGLRLPLSDAKMEATASATGRDIPRWRGTDNHSAQTYIQIQVMTCDHQWKRLYNPSWPLRIVCKKCGEPIELRRFKVKEMLKEKV